MQEQIRILKEEVKSLKAAKPIIVEDAVEAQGNSGSDDEPREKIKTLREEDEYTLLRYFEVTRGRLFQGLLEGTKEQEEEALQKAGIETKGERLLTSTYRDGA